jgi:hypothetical protein
LGVTTGEVGRDEVDDRAGFGGTAGLLCILDGFGGNGGAGLPGFSVDLEDTIGSSSSLVGVADWMETLTGEPTRDLVLPPAANREFRRDAGGVDDIADGECLLTMSSTFDKHVRITDIIEL